MGKKVKMLNEYHIKALLERDDTDFNKFYKEELIEFIEVAKQEIKQLKIQVSSREEIANKYKEVIDEARECIKNNYHLNWYVESNYKDELLQILDKGVDK